MPSLIFYSKPGCHLCDGLKEKLDQLPHLSLQIEIRDITQNPAWFAQYQYEIPVLCRLIKPTESSTGEDSSHLGQPVEQPLPRLSPRASVSQLERMLQTYLGPFEAE
ncbi:MAG: glutaredoxin family protein [Cyanobacteria bacterium P01_A01_bin.105]